MELSWNLQQLGALLLAAGTRPEKIRIQKWYTVYKDHITLADYEIHDGMGECRNTSCGSSRAYAGHSWWLVASKWVCMGKRFSCRWLQALCWG